MKKMVFAVMFAVMLFATMSTSYAERGDWRGGIRERIHEDQQRIERGLRHGSLTQREAERLNRELAGILHEMDQMRSDGHLDRRERERINRDLDRMDRHITREKRDRERSRY
ncbi:MAG: hypothetical protein V2B20_04390 [Pseudomonadota bacterium]